MKYIKQFEYYNENKKYRVGTYVYISLNRFAPESFSNLGKITNKGVTLGGNHYYDILLSSDDFIIGDDTSILRKLTKDEIEKYDAEISSKKYNL